MIFRMVSNTRLVGTIAGVFIALILAINFLPGLLSGTIDLGGNGENGEEPTLTAVIGTNRFPTITTFITNAITGANVGDDTNDHAYIIELQEEYATSSYSAIKTAYLANPGDVVEPRAGWDDTTPPAAGVASRDTYEVGSQLLIYIDAQTEHDIVYLYTVEEPDFQATTVQVAFPVFAPAAAWAETYRTEISTPISATAAYDLSNEGGDTEDQIMWEIRSTTADSILGWFFKDPIYDATRYQNNIPYFYVTSNLSAMMVTDANAAWDDGAAAFNYFIDLSNQMVAPADWGCPSYLQVISGTPVGINVDADAFDGTVSGIMTWSVMTATGGMTCGLEASDWDQEFGLGTPTGDVTELIQVQA